jgi:signal transduction histidine kinase
MTEDADLIARLVAHRTIGKAPREELARLAAHGALMAFDRGALFPQHPGILAGLTILFSGRFAIYVDHGAGRHKVMEWTGGDVTGLLPYSRMTKPVGDVFVDEPGEAFHVHRGYFQEMIRECPTVTTLLVHIMVDRARSFRSSELQDEKMLSLGRLSAGLAHELNNPASAAARSAKLLVEGLGEAEEAARALGAARLSDAQLAVIDRARHACANATPSALDPIERADREEAIADWLVKHGGDAGAAGALTDTSVTIDGLDGMAATLDAGTLNVALRWVAAGCTTRVLASEIERAAVRIHKLVGAMKRSSYMDRAQVAEPVDLVESLNDSVTLLLHKARKKSVGVDLDIEAGLPPARAIGGDLNQVWTNLIDNAIDAVSDGGHVRISANRQLDFIIVRIVDDGHGVPADMRERIFDPFVTTKPVGQGTGLGLDIARQLIRRNSGDIEFESQPGRTEFRVTLPVASEAAPTAGA